MASVVPKMPMKQYEKAPMMKKGGKARAKRMTPEERSEAARKN